MKKSNKIVAVIMSLVMVCTLVFVPTDALAGSKDKLDSLQSKIESAQSKVDKNNKKAAKINGNMSELEKDIAVIEKQVYALEDKVRYAQIKVEKTRKKLNENNKKLDERLRNMYKSGGMGFVDIILSSENISDLFSNFSMVQYIFENDKNVVGQLEKDYKKLEEMREKLKANQEKLNAKQDQLGANYAKLEDSKAQLKAENKDLKQTIAQWQADSAAIEEQIKQAQAQAQAQAQQNQNNGGGGSSNNGGGGGGYVPSSGSVSSQGMVWPVPSSSLVTSEYGWRNLGGYSDFHLGIDIAASYGADVVAAADGVVIATGGQHWSYGNIVIIDHGNGVATAYAHNSSIVVSTGQVVKRGQVIAKIGSTGNSTGNHCHFEVRINGQTVNPRGYL